MAFVEPSLLVLCLLDFHSVVRDGADAFLAIWFGRHGQIVIVVIDGVIVIVIPGFEKESMVRWEWRVWWRLLERWHSLWQHDVDVEILQPQQALEAHTQA